LLSIFCKSLELLPVRSCGIAYFKGVLSQLPRDTRHVKWASCKNVSVVLEKTGEREFLFGVEVGPDGDFLGCMGQAEANFLHSRTWVQGGCCTLLFWHLQGSLVDLGSLATMTVAAALHVGILERLMVSLSQL
jgi:hypothetical protein